MKRATITIDDNLERALDLYVSQQKVQPTLNDVVEVALAEYLARRGSTPPTHRLHITPASPGSGQSDVSEQHDRYFSE
jgi:hypothetical protein